MSIAKKYNHRSPFIFKAGDNFKYYSLKQLFEANKEDSVYTVLALYINNKGKYGDQPLALTPHYYINLPAHLLGDVYDMIHDPEIVEQINKGMAGFKIRTYDNKNGGKSYSVEWMDLPEPPAPTF